MSGMIEACIQEKCQQKFGNRESPFHFVMNKLAIANLVKTELLDFLPTQNHSTHILAISFPTVL